MKPLLVCLLLLFSSEQSAAQCLSLAEHDPNTSVDFLTALTDSLGELQAAKRSMDSVAEGKSGAEILTSLDIANEALDCAAQTINPYSASKNEGVQVAADSISTMAKMLAATNGELRKEMVAVLNGERDQEKAGDAAERQASFANAYRQDWHLLTPAITAALLGTIEFEPAPTMKLGRLRITSSERSRLNERLLRIFPRADSDALPSESAWPEAAAYLLYFGLNKKGWPTHDQPFPSAPQ